MNSYNISKIKILPESQDPLFEQRELEMSHTPFRQEAILFSYLRLGDVTNVISAIDVYINQGFVVGRLSKNNLRQMQYWAVSTIALGIHYAILGGLDETDAYNLSDTYIRHIDECKQVESILPYLYEKALELTKLVADSKIHESYSPSTKQCIHYIHLHLHNKITVAELATVCNLSKDYCSLLFKKDVGRSVSSYIRSAKLEASKVLLVSNCNYSTICYNYGFCSESHYIECFRKEYGLTPKEYLKSHPTL